MSDEIGNEFQQQTKYLRTSVQLGGMRGSEPEVYKRYPDAPSTALPKPLVPADGSLWDALAARRSVRRYEDTPITLETLSLLLWSFNGVTARAGRYEFRSAPSAGALYPIETYLAANNIEGVEPAAYHHNIPDWSLERVREGPQGRNLVDACLMQKMCAASAVTFVWTAVVQRSRWKYAQRAYRYIYLDAGHIGAQLHLAAEALGLGCCMIGAFFDEEVNNILGVDGEEETAIYMASVGLKRDKTKD